MHCCWSLWAASSASEGCCCRSAAAQQRQSRAAGLGICCAGGCACLPFPDPATPNPQPCTHTSIQIMNNNQHHHNRNHSNNTYTLQQMLDVCSTSLVLPGWLVLGIMVGTCDVQTSKFLDIVAAMVFCCPSCAGWVECRMSAVSSKAKVSHKQTVHVPASVQWVRCNSGV